MAKYDALFRYLCPTGGDAVEMTFDEIEQLVGALPAAATARREWWSNEHTHPTAHTRAWLDAGRQVTKSIGPIGGWDSAPPAGAVAPDLVPRQKRSGATAPAGGAES